MLLAQACPRDDNHHTSFNEFSALSCVVQVETEEDSLSQAAFNQLEDKLKQYIEQSSGVHYILYT